MADSRRAAANNIYTVLAFVAFLVLGFGVVYVCFRYAAVFGGLPFTASAKQAMLDLTLPLLA